MIGETKVKILQMCAKGATWTSMIKVLGVVKATLYQHLNELQSKKYITKENGKYVLTPKGSQYLARVFREKFVAQVKPFPARVADFASRKLIEKRRSRAKQVAFAFASTPLERLKLGLSLAIFRERWTRLSPEMQKRINVMIDTIEDKINIALYPLPERTTQEMVAKVVFEVVGKIFKDKDFRSKVAESKKLAIVFTLDLSNLEESKKVLDFLLYWVFV